MQNPAICKILRGLCILRILGFKDFKEEYRDEI